MDNCSQLNSTVYIILCGFNVILAKQLTLSQPGGQIMSTIILKAPPGFSDLATALYGNLVQHIPDGKDIDWQTKDKPRQVTSRIVMVLSSIVYFFLLDGNVEGYQSHVMYEQDFPSTFIGEVKLVASKEQLLCTRAQFTVWAAIVLTLST